MSYNEVLQILIAVCPLISAVLAVIIGFLSLTRTIKAIKSENDDTKEKALLETQKSNNLMNKLFAKISSIEQTLLEEHNKEGK